MDWWKGKDSYDPSTGLPKDNQAITKSKSFNYTRLVWKTAKTVGFGIEGSWVVAWVCGDTITAEPKADVVKENVPSKECTKKTTNPTG